ncbi:MAG: hypothetical protein KDA61_06820 [Planctomycetales bacterium]|nr:hypothetical protein [Planctomycetales bacterium]
MSWLFERMIELAAWVAFILGAIFLVESAVLLVQWFTSFRSVDPDSAAQSTHLLAKSAQAAASFVASALAMGVLACIDRYVFDLPEQS